MGSNEPDLKALGGLSNIITKLMFQQTTGKEIQTFKGVVVEFFCRKSRLESNLMVIYVDFWQ